jgi:S1-C subfamily serine protease
MLALQMLLVAGLLGAGPTEEPPIGQTSRVVLLSFTQENCPPCRAMEPVLAEVEASGLPVQLIKVEDHPDFVKRFNISGTPTYVMMVDNRETGRVVGVTTAAKLLALSPQDGVRAAVRGQSPETTGYLNERLGGLFGKGGKAAADSAPAADPFTQHQARQAAARDASPESPSQVKTLQYEAEEPQAVDPQARAMAATVRLRVEEPQGQAIGTGTIVDTKGDESLLVTCAHIFRASKGKGRIQVELFHPQRQTVEGTLIEYNLEKDIAVVSIKAGPSAISAPVAPTGLTVQKHESAFSVGCDKGADPTIRETKITNLNRYVGPANIEAAGEPTIGRSGGGLFNRDGYLIGVCNCADAQDNEGIYAAIESIHWQLEKVGLAELFKSQAKPADTRSPAIATADYQEVSPRELSPRPPVATSTLDQDDLEIIAIVRPRGNSNGKGNVFVIPKASQQLLQQIAANSADPTTAADLALTADRRSAAAPLPGTGPIVRGQSQQ